MIADRRMEIQVEKLLGRVTDLENLIRRHDADINIINNENTISESAKWMGKLVLFDNIFEKVAFYDPDSVGFDKALLAAEDGDIILIPPCSIADDHTMIAGVKVVGRSRYATILTGKITGADDASIENLSVIQSVNSAANLVGVCSPATGTFYINDCDIEVTQAGAGNAYGFSADVNNTLIEIWNSFISGDSTGGTGYAGYRDTGTSATAHIYGGRAYGSTKPFNV